MSTDLGTFLSNGVTAVEYLSRAVKDVKTNKVDKISGKGLSTEDFTTAAKSKLESLENYDDTALAGRVSTVESTVAGKVDKVEGKGLSTEDFTTEEKTKLSGLSNYDDTALAGRVSTAEGNITTLQGNLASKADLVEGKIPAIQLPSYVDDVVEGYADTTTNKFYSDSEKTTEITLEQSKIYIDLSNNKTYRFSGNVLVPIASDLALGETASTAFAGNRGKALEDAMPNKQDKLPTVVANNYLMVDSEGNLVWNPIDSLHTHKTTDNYNETSKLLLSSESNTGFEKFGEVVVGSDEDTFSFIEMGYHILSIVNDEGHAFAQLVNDKTIGNSAIQEIGTGVANIKELHSSSKTLAAITTDGKLYTREYSAITKVSAPGTMQGTTDVGTTTWTQVGSATNWDTVSGNANHWLLLNTNGQLFTAGRNAACLQGTAAIDGNGDPIFTPNVEETIDTKLLGAFVYLVTAPTEIKIEESGNLVAKTDWLQISAGAYHSMALRGSNGKGKIYLWGANHVGQIGDGVRYFHDMVQLYAWVNGNTTLYSVKAPGIITLDADKTIALDTNIYTDATTMTTAGAIESFTNTTITIGGVVYTYDSTADIYPYKTGQVIPKVLSLEDGTVYDDWEKISAGYYHSGAIRHNNKGESEVYLWGCNEYGCIGNGNYYDESLSQSSLSEGSWQQVEIVAWPRKLTAADGFPYTDVVDIQCSHYGTLLYRANGEIYFAGCNKRNFFGTGVNKTATAFIPKFTKLSSYFNNKKIYTHTYGGVTTKNTYHVKSDADVAVKAVLYNELSAEALSEAIQSAHVHSLDTTVIDQIAMFVNQHMTGLQTAAMNAHGHSNLTSLNQLSVKNGYLYINNKIYGGGSEGGSGSGVYVDESNIKQDSLTDISGLNNIAGGMALDIISCNIVSDEKTVIRVSPLGSQVQKVDRYVDLYNAAGTTVLISKENQQKGIFIANSANTTFSTYTGQFVNCSKDIVSFISSKTSGYFRFYIINDAKGESETEVDWLANKCTQLAVSGATNVARSTIATLTFKYENATGIYSTDDLDSVGVSTLYEEEDNFETIYDGQGNPLIFTSISELPDGSTKPTFDTEFYYNDNGTVKTLHDIGELVNAIGMDENDKPIYPTLYDNNGLSGEPVLTSAQITEGIFVKIGTSLMSVRSFMTPEEFSVDLFTTMNPTSQIFIHPTKTTYVGMANQVYVYDNSKIQAITETTGTETTLSSVILVLNKRIEKFDSSSTSTDTFEVGSVSDPMIACIYSPNSYATSSVNGEFNAAIGKNSNAAGNSNMVAGNFSNATGLSNVVIGEMSSAFGVGNSVVGVKSFTHGSGNNVAGDTNFVVGYTNTVGGYYANVFGTRNQIYGVDNFAVGSSNEMFSARSGAVGSGNKFGKKVTDSFALGKSNIIDASKCIVVGQNGKIPEYTGTFPTDEQLTTTAAYANTVYPYTTLGFSESGRLYKGSFVITNGESMANNQEKPLIIMAYTKYAWTPNNAYMSLTTNALRKSSSLDKMIETIDHRWDFTGKVFCNFAVNAENREFRNAGRVITCDPGIELTEADVVIVGESTSTITLDFEKAYKFKIKGTATGVLALDNWTDGSEGYVVIYSGTNVTFPAEWVTEGVEAPAVTAGSFVLYKLIVIDSIVICKKIASHEVTQQ